jgi:hypothetical protein
MVLPLVAAASASYSVNGTEAPPLTANGETVDTVGAALAVSAVIASARPPAARAAAVAVASQTVERRLVCMVWGVPFLQEILKVRATLRMSYAERQYVDRISQELDGLQRSRKLTARNLRHLY